MPVQFSGYILRTANPMPANYVPRRQRPAEAIRKDIKSQFDFYTKQIVGKINDEVAEGQLDFDEARIELQEATQEEKELARDEMSPKDKRLIFHFDQQETRDYLTDLWLSAPPLRSPEQKERGAFTRAVLGKLDTNSTINDVKAVLNSPTLLTAYRISQLSPDNQRLVNHFTNSMSRKYLSEYCRDFPQLSPNQQTEKYGQFMREQLQALPSDIPIQDLKPAMQVARFKFQLACLPNDDQDLIRGFTHSSTQKCLLDFCITHSISNPNCPNEFGKNVRERLKTLPPNTPLKALESAIARVRFEYNVSLLPQDDQDLIARFTHSATRNYVSKFCLAHSDFRPNHNEEFGLFVRQKLNTRHPQMPIDALEEAMKRWEFEYELSSFPEDDQRLISRFKNHETQKRVLDFCFDHSTMFNPKHDKAFGQYVRNKLSTSPSNLKLIDLEADLTLYKARFDKRR